VRAADPPAAHRAAAVVEAEEAADMPAGSQMIGWKLVAAAALLGTVTAAPALADEASDCAGGEAAACRHLADRGDPLSQALLGSRYANGRGGVPRDYVQAYLWLSLAASQETFDRVLAERSWLAARMTPAQLAKAEGLAAAWRPIIGR
jgi:TPR repeat protein